MDLALLFFGVRLPDDKRGERVFDKLDKLRAKGIGGTCLLTLFTAVLSSDFDRKLVSMGVLRLAFSLGSCLKPCEEIGIVSKESPWNPFAREEDPYSVDPICALGGKSSVNFKGIDKWAEFSFVVSWFASFPGSWIQKIIYKENESVKWTCKKEREKKKKKNHNSPNVTSCMRIAVLKIWEKTILLFGDSEQ